MKVKITVSFSPCHYEMLLTNFTAGIQRTHRYKSTHMLLIFLQRNKDGKAPDYDVQFDCNKQVKRVKTADLMLDSKQIEEFIEVKNALFDKYFNSNVCIVSLCFFLSRFWFLCSP